MDKRGILDWPPKDKNGNSRVVRIGGILERFSSEQLASFSTTDIEIENVPEVN